jgi:hypothetical protein
VNSVNNSLYAFDMRQQLGFSKRSAPFIGVRKEIFLLTPINTYDRVIISTKISGLHYHGKLKINLTVI